MTGTRVRWKVGGDYLGYKNAINSNRIRHILKEHGPVELVDHSMGTLNDISRMGHISALRSAYADYLFLSGFYQDDMDDLVRVDNRKSEAYNDSGIHSAKESNRAVQQRKTPVLENKN
jgi:hypothetical protein